MPVRKRKTKAAARPKPKLPDGDEGKDLEQIEKAEKLNMFLKDFDLEVEKRVDNMRKEGKKIIDQINHLYRIESIKIPKHIRDMKRSQFLENKGNNIDRVALQASDIAADQVVEKVMNSINARDAAAKAGKENSKTQTRTTRRGKRMGPPPSTTRGVGRTRQAMETPAQRGGPSAAGWETPLITPKFDPRLPQTPFLRDPKPGERILSMSGSPLMNKNINKRVATVQLPLGLEKTLLLTGNTLIEEEEVPHLDADAITQLQQLQEKLASIVKVATKS